MSVDKSGFALVIPKMFIERINKGKTGKMIFSDQIVSITSEIDDNYIVAVPAGCQLTDDFWHAGADNVSSKLVLDDQQPFMDWISKVANHIVTRDVSLKELF